MKTVKRILSTMLTLAMVIPFCGFIEIQADDKIAINSTNFPDKNFRQFIIDMEYDQNNDNYLSEQEIAAVTYMNASFLDAEDLKGVEYFSELTALTCSANKLKHLNISPFAKLELLNCNSNQLTKLDVSSNTKLRELACAQNKLTSLDLKSNKELWYLVCDNNQLSYLDVQANTKLEVIYCCDNQLTSLNVRGLRNLDRLWCYNNKLKVLNLITTDKIREYTKQKKHEYSNYVGYGTTEDSSGYHLQVDASTALVTSAPDGILVDVENFPDVNFLDFIIVKGYDKNEDYILSKTELAAVTEMDCSWEHIEDMTGIEHFTALKVLKFMYNPLTSLDVSKNTALEKLTCYCTHLTSLDISKNTALEYLWCAGNPLTSLDVSKNTALEILDCMDNKLTSLDVSKNTALKRLICINNKLTSLTIRGLKNLDELRCYNNPSLKSLDVSTSDKILAYVKGEKYEATDSSGINYVGYGIAGYNYYHVCVDPAMELITDNIDPAVCKVFGFCEYKGKKYWYENGVRQGTMDDPQNVMGDGTPRGREIYDAETDGWYWLDAIYDGAKAEGKEVWVPYIYQDDYDKSDSDLRVLAGLSDAGLEDYMYQCLKNRTGKWIRYDEKGKMIKGWITITGELAKIYPNQAGNTYYYDTMTGVMAKGWITMNGQTYHFDEVTGALIN